MVSNTVELQWKPPRSDSNSAITGYLVEKRDERSDDWFVVYDRVRQSCCSICSLVVGNNYYFRIKAINDVGVGVPVEVGPVSIPKPAPVDLSLFATQLSNSSWAEMIPPQERPHKPEFTTPLNTRTLVVGYR